ncbi:hypothetical protein [Bacillus alkalicellulosilyticus]|uniref:hypothetical protein n=1 Tax=Alkalihalobacterium alkalicellulosilyticum TaxID=1912214 RepID=UPI0009983660|nr:hypothetical protein [Bacillus alkalicellulosilyticus]
MKKQEIKTFFILFFIFLTGVFSGLLIDKDWLSEQEFMYYEQIRAENKLLHYEREHWLAFVGDQLSPVPIYIYSEEDSEGEISHLLQQVGIEPVVVKTIDTVLEKEGIFVALGHELHEEFELPHVVVDVVPHQDHDILQFYLSLLKVRGEIFRDEG